MYDLLLETFITVAENGSFSKAAEALYITPTGVMKQINALEKRLKVILFVRTKRGLKLTDAGASMLRDAKYIIDYSRRSMEKARKIECGRKKKTVRIGLSVMTPVKFLSETQEKIGEKGADFKVELVPFENTQENARDILKSFGKHIDMVAGIYDDALLSESRCRVAHLSDKQVALAVPLSHPLCKRGNDFAGLSLFRSTIMLASERVESLYRRSP